MTATTLCASSASASVTPSGLTGGKKAAQASASDPFAHLLSLASAHQSPPAQADASVHANPNGAPTRQPNTAAGHENPAHALLGWLQTAHPATLGQQGEHGSSAAHLSSLPGRGAVHPAGEAAATPAGKGIDLPGRDATENRSAPEPARAAAPTQARGADAAATHKAAASHPFNGNGAPAREPPFRASLATPLQQLQASAPASLRALSTAGSVSQAPLTRSTVALHERFGRSLSVESLGAEPAPRVTPASAANLPPGPTGDFRLPTAGAPGNEGARPAGGADAAAPSSESAVWADPAPTDLEAQQISRWSSPHLDHASLHVGHGSEDRIDIELALSAQELQVEFRTDNAATRASLEHTAELALAELLQRSGIELGSVSVSSQEQAQAQSRSPQRGQEHSGGQREQARQETAAGEPLAAASAAAPAPQRADGSQALDLFV